MSADTPALTDRRVMRIVLPVGLVREIDAIILGGRGGYQTRAEFILDAIQERLSELAGAEIDAGRPAIEDIILGPAQHTTAADHVSAPQTSPAAFRASAQPSSAVNEHASSPRTDASGLDRLPPLGPPPKTRTLEAARPTGTGSALFGLHNRDFPSLWCLRELAEMCVTEFPPVEDFYRAVLKRAWDYGQQLKEHEQRTGIKSTALFPTNPEKRKAAEGVFRNFAIGDYNLNVDSGPSTYGPLYEWQAIALGEGDSGPIVAPTATGLALLAAVQDVSVTEPHTTASARRFLAHLAEHAPADFTCFESVLQAVGATGSSRSELLASLARAWPTWTENELSTNAAGYVARAREWGLVQAKQTQGRYYLTDFGLELLTPPTEESR